MILSEDVSHSPFVYLCALKLILLSETETCLYYFLSPVETLQLPQMTTPELNFAYVIEFLAEVYTDFFVVI